jgi:hypothetical protein
LATIAAEMGEPFVPGEIEELLRQTTAVTRSCTTGTNEARTAYFNGRADVEIGAAQRLLTGTVGRPTMTTTNARRRPRRSCSPSRRGSFDLIPHG